MEYVDKAKFRKQILAGKPIYLQDMGTVASLSEIVWGAICSDIRKIKKERVMKYILRYWSEQLKVIREV